jgi:hypothetical protein
VYLIDPAAFGTLFEEGIRLILRRI